MHFTRSYDAARAQFRARAAELAASHPGAEVGHYDVPSATDRDLTTDYLFLPARAPKRLVIVTSGVHGAEAFVGSAVQDMLMRRWLPNVKFDDTSVLVVHSLNPWGHRHRRRVTEDNVDLNRNLSIDPALFQTPNAAYAQLDAFLNPRRPVSLWDVYTDVVGLGAELRRHGATVLRNATLFGQYERAQGIYFGGFAPVPQKASMEALFTRYIAPHQLVLLMDLHTGYGERGRLHYFGDAGARGKVAMRSVFAGYAIDSAETNADFYTTNGDMVVWLGGLVPADKTYLGTTLEYGTLDSQTVVGGIRSLQRMRLENQGFHHGFASERARRGVQQRFADMFDPPDARWRRQILDATIAAVPVLVERFQRI